MKTAIVHITLVFALALAFVGCQQNPEVVPSDGKGTLILALTDAQLYTDTRSEIPVADITNYVFTLNGTTISGAPVNDLIVSFDNDATAQVAAGTYTLTATNEAYANTGYGHPFYSGTSASFTIDVNDSQAVGIALGKPKNARLTMAVDESFSALYENPVLTLSDDARSVTLTSSDVECYFIIPASGALAYTITADALAGSHATDMTSATGYVEIQAGYNTTVRLKANPATGIIIPVAEGGYSGTFD